MLSEFAFWPCATLIVFLVLGLVANRKELSAAVGADKLLPLGRVFVATPLAVFGAEHLAGPRSLMQAVPVWMPGRLFWAYLVGCALFAAALSLSLKKCVRLSSTLLAIMFFLFVLMIHLPNVIAHPGSRILWAVAARDLSFGGGALAFAGAMASGRRAHGVNWAVLVGGVILAITLIFFGIENILHPHFAPGVPLPKLMPAWVPLPALWACLTGAIMVIAGGGILLNRHARIGAMTVGTLMALLTLLLYLPILLMARGTAPVVEGVNYVADTLLFGGMVLLLAQGLPTHGVHASGRGAERHSAGSQLRTHQWWNCSKVTVASGRR